MNALLFMIFIVHINAAQFLPRMVVFEYFFDNAVAFTFVFFIAFNAFTINQQIMDRLKNELSERKRTEKALSDSERKLSDHLKNTPVGAIFWDLSFRITEWNPAAERIFGYTKDEVMGRHVANLILPEEMKQPVERIFQDLLSGCGGAHSINENMTKSGKRILCDWYNSVFRSADGKITGAASLVNDITQQAKMQEVMIQSEKMMSVGGLAAGMAHEVNNPLAGIIQNAQLVENRLAGHGPANERVAADVGIPLSAVQEYTRERGVLKLLDNIRGAGGRAVTVIENMLNFSRKKDRLRESFPLAALIDDTLAIAGHDHVLKRQYAFRDIGIVRDYAPDLPAVFGEKIKIQQVMLNLFKNASDAMNMKAYENEAPRLTIRLKKDRQHIRIQVEDNGIGMHPDTCAHIFEPFFSTKENRGTGLGLSISYHIIVQDHGGQISVASTPGRGTCFTVKLPFRVDREPPAS